MKTIPQTNQTKQRLVEELLESNRIILEDNRQIFELGERVKELEKDAERLQWLLNTGLAWRGCYQGSWMEGEWLYAQQSAREVIDGAMVQQTERKAT